MISRQAAKTAKKGFPLREVILAGMIFSLSASAQSPDPVFRTIPFDQWLTERDQAHFQWNAKVSGGHLTNTQRLGASVDVEVDGNELAKRRGRGELAIFVQFSDTDHRVYQTHGSIELKNATEEAAKSNIFFSQKAVVAPGDYRVDIAMLDTNTREHATLTRTLHVAPLRNDPLPDAMQGLPLVEFNSAGDPPDIWFQPDLTGVLHLPLEMRSPLRVEILANASPSSIGPRFRTGELNSRILADLLPGLKVISQIQLSQGEMNVSLIDITRRQVLFKQTHVQTLDWPKLRPALQQADPNKIDVRELSDSRQNPQFFVQEVRRRLKEDTALIVLSGPIAFVPSDDRRPIELEGKASGRVFYLRYHPAPVRRDIEEIPTRPRRGRLSQQPSALLTQEPLDSLAPMLKALQPHVYDIYNAEQFRKALSDVMKELARM
jgi:hypothetical protein